MWLNFRNPVAVADGKEVEAKKAKQAIYKARQQEIQSTVSEERWQGKLIKNRWDDKKVKLENCFAWLSSWKNVLTHTIAGVQELYQQLLPTEVYYNRKTKSEVTDEKCRLCGDSLENVQQCTVVHWHRLSIYRGITMISRFYSLKSSDLKISLLEPWFSQVTPKQLHENEHATAFWDVPLFADATQSKS